MYLNVALVMLLGGLWHGANWTFMVWGAWHGGLLIIERAMGKRSVYGRFPRAVRVCVTFVLVLFGWVMFRSASLGAGVGYLASMFGFGAAGGGAALTAASLYTPGNLLAAGICAVLAFGKRQAFDYAETLTWRKVWVLVALFATSLAVMSAQAFNPFLYFQF